MLVTVLSVVVSGACAHVPAPHARPHAPQRPRYIADPRREVIYAMTRIPFPSRRPQGPQIECCALCQRLVNADELYYADVEGLRGQPICVYHGDLGTRPSYTDLRGIDDTLIAAVNAAVREQPFGDEVWWDADGDGYLLLEDATTGIRQENGLDGIRLEHVTT